MNTILTINIKRALAFALLISAPDFLAAQPGLRSGFKKGVVVDQYGQPYPGLLKNPATAVLLFIGDGTSRKEKLTPRDIKAFRIEKDSFLVLNEYQVPMQDYKISGFAEVILKAPGGVICTINWYVKWRIEKTDPTTYAPPPPLQTGKTVKHFLLLRDRQFIQITDFNFYREMPLVIADNEPLKNKIVSKKLTFKHMDKIAEEYEQWRNNRR